LFLNKKKAVLLVIVLMILSVFFIKISEYRLSYKSALQARTKIKNIELLESVNINKDLDLILYKNLDNENYGFAELFNFLHILYRPGSTAQGYAVQKGSPFLVVSNYRENKYIIFIKTNDSKIKYVSIGTEKCDFTEEEYESYSVSLDEVKNKPKIYRTKQLQNGTACFIGALDNYEKFIDYNMIMGFDENGNLAADRRGEMYGRYIKR
jgi:hypothetical protein